MDDSIKKQIHAYIDGALSASENAKVEAAISQDKAVNAYFRATLKTRANVKRLESRKAFSHFAERWPKRVRSAHQRLVMQRRVVRVASSVAAVAVVAIVGWQFVSLRGGVAKEQMMDSAMVAEEPMAMEVMEEAAEEMMVEAEAPMAKEAAPEAALMADEAGEAKAEDTQAANEAEDRAGEINIVLNPSDYAKVLDDLTALTADDEIKPEIEEENVFSMLVTEENLEGITALLEQMAVQTDELVPDMLLIFSQE